MMGLVLKKFKMLEKSRKIGDLKVRGEINMEGLYDKLDETGITGELLNKDKCNVGLNIEDIEDVNKRKKSMDDPKLLWVNTYIYI